MPWTKEQQKVIDQRDADILVSAAAGSGKTAVLVERIIQKVVDEESPLDVDRLLVVTFTKAAAGEMKERIASALDRKVKEFPQNQHYARQLALIHKAQITTIHSFCMNLVKDYFYVLGIDPNISPGEEGRLSGLRSEVLDEILEEAYAKREPHFLNLIESYSPGKNDKIINDYILKLYQTARSHVRPEQWLCEAEENLCASSLEEFRNAPFVQYIFEDAREAVENAVRMIKKAVDLAQQDSGPYFYLKTFEQDLEIFKDFQNAESFREYCEKFLTLKKPRLSGRKKKADMIDAALQDQCKKLRERAYGLIGDIQSAYFYAKEEEIYRELTAMKVPLSALIHLTREFMERYSQKKIEENVMDFDDMEHFALKLLIDHFDENGNPVPSKIAEEKSGEYEEIYIDEYQDSNYIQDAILRSVSKEAAGGHNMFMVGDVKQSIYSFRLARPELFLEKYHRYQKKGEEYQLIELRNNFRSRKEVLHFVNDIFYEIMHESLGNIEYTENAALVPTMEFLPGCDATAQLLLLDGEAVRESEEEAMILEARMIAEKIHDMVDGENPMMITGKDEDGNPGLRKAKYSDIVILLRSMKGNAETLQKELMNAGIPAFANSQKGYFDTVEVRTVLSLLAVVDNIYQDIDMAAVLRSPIIGMSEEELGWVKVEGNADSLYQCLKNTAETMELSKKALSLLEQFREAKTYLPLTQLLWLILDETGYYHYAGAMPQGKKRQGNLLMLVEQAKAFEDRQIRGLFHFIRFIEQCKDYDMDFGEANIMGEDEDLVHISSIHKSKGLEYPIVFVSKMHQKFNLRDSSGSIIFHGDYFIGADRVDPVHRRKQKTVLKSMIARQMKKDALGEELRVLYVAMTRAKEKLILTGIRKEEISWEKSDRAGYADLISAGSYLDWILRVLPQVPKDDYQLKIWTAEDFVWTDIRKEVQGEMNKEMFLQRLYEQIPQEAVMERKETFAYQYRDQAETTGQLKYSVSEIKRMSQEADPEESLYFSAGRETQRRIPEFMKEKQKLSAASRGTAVHKVLELLDFTKDYTMKSLKEQIASWCEEGKLKKEYEKIVYRKDILIFLQSDLGKRIKRAAINRQLYQEQQFVLGVPFSEMSEGGREDSYVVVQGIIDLYFEEEGDLVLVDYKTDRVTQENGRDILKKRYEVQLRAYQQALEQMTGKTVKETIIYSMALGESISIS